MCEPKNYGAITRQRRHRGRDKWAERDYACMFNGRGENKELGGTENPAKA